MSDNIEPKEEFLAFPLTFDNPQSNQRYVHTGMTLRDYFATAALQSLLARYYIDSELSEEVTDVVSSYAYKLADAMMKVRDESE